MVTSDLDEHAIAALAAAPVDAYGVGTSPGHRLRRAHRRAGLQAGRPRRTTAAPLVAVAKKSKDKATVGGRKWALRRRGAHGVAEAEVIGIGEHAGATTATTGRCWSSCVRGGEVVATEPTWSPPASGTSGACRSCRRGARQLSRGEPAIPTIYENIRG